MEFDHLFICVKPNAIEAELLKEFGLTEGSSNLHPGQGTANRRFFFHNSMLELLFLTDVDEATSEATNRTKLHERLMREDGHASPFGLCFRPIGNGEKDKNKEVGFPAWHYKPGYLPDHLHVDVGDAPVNEPMWFFLSFSSRPDSTPLEKQQPLIHSIAVKEISSLNVSVPRVGDRSKTAQYISSKVNNINIIEGEEHLLEICFDNEIKGMSHDWRPALPVIFKW